MFKPSTTLTSLRELLAGSKTDKVKRQGDLRGWTLPWRIQAAPQSNPADSEILRSTTNGIQERGKGPFALPPLPTGREQVSTGCGGTLGLSQKPTPSGKPKDLLTETRDHGR
mgnify:CR=1 FL=1